MKTILKLIPFILFALLLFLSALLAKFTASPYTMGIVFNAVVLGILFIRLNPGKI